MTLSSRHEHAGNGGIRHGVWSHLIVTLVTVLIWLWAAGETRERRTMNFVRVQFTVAEPSNWVLTPSQQPLTLTVEGSPFALQKADQLFRRPVKLNLAAARGVQIVDITSQLPNLEEFRALGIRLIASEPQTVEVDLDEIIRAPVRVKPVLPGVVTDGEIEVEPSEVTLAAPSEVLDRYPRGVSVEAYAERFELENLQPGERQSLEVKLQTRERLSPAEATISPAKARVTFTVRSRTRETVLDTVPIQLSALPAVGASHHVELLTNELRQVTITGDSDLIRRIEAKEVPVTAVVHISPREAQTRIDSKPVSYFIALLSDGNGGIRGEQVKARVGDSIEPPVIPLRITELPDQ